MKKGLHHKFCTISLVFIVKRYHQWNSPHTLILKNKCFCLMQIAILPSPDMKFTFQKNITQSNGIWNFATFFKCDFMYFRSLFLPKFKQNVLFVGCLYIWVELKRCSSFGFFLKTMEKNQLDIRIFELSHQNASF